MEKCFLNVCWEGKGCWRNCSRMALRSLRKGVLGEDYRSRWGSHGTFTAAVVHYPYGGSGWLLPYWVVRDVMCTACTVSFRYPFSEALPLLLSDDSVIKTQTVCPIWTFTDVILHVRLKKSNIELLLMNSEFQRCTSPHEDWLAQWKIAMCRLAFMACCGA